MEPDSGALNRNAARDKVESLDGVLERITYQNEENGYTVARLRIPRYKKPVTIAGHLPSVSVGEGLRVAGAWIDHPVYGKQFQVTHFQSSRPSTTAAIKKYLGSGLLKGVGPVVAEHIVNTFGSDTLDILDAHPSRLGEVPGLGRRRAQSIAAEWAERRALKDLMFKLEASGVPMTLTARIIRKFGGASATIINEQPYRLAAEVFGVTFQIADALALGQGVSTDAPQRVAAAVLTVLREGADSGHVFLPAGELVARASRLLRLPASAVEAALPTLARTGSVVAPQSAVAGMLGDAPVYAPELYASEGAVVELLHALEGARINRLAKFEHVDWEQAWRYVASRETVQLTEQPRSAVRTALLERVSVITGGPGTGKTTTLRGIVRLVQARGGTVVLAAPTGRAARRLSEATGASASTIHRLLELRPGGLYEPKAPIDADLVIVDEASMMDLPLAEALLKAVPAGAHLLLVGDADQLPPVGPGSVFRDVIACGRFHTVRLERIFRQPEGSAIVANAHRINAGEPPVTGKEIKDFYFLGRQSPADCADLVVELATQRIPAGFGLSPWDDIQVMAPIYRGVCGVESLNARLQAVLNPAHPTKDERRYGDRIFRVGDKVMQVVNSYEKQVANGDIGRIARIDLEEELVEVSFEGEWVAAYSFQELDELTHGFAISVHKAQGSEYPAVIIPVLPQHGRMLQRNLLYTAVSRAKRLVIMVGSRQALQRGVENNQTSRRYTSLVERLQSTGI